MIIIDLYLFVYSKDLQRKYDLSEKSLRRQIGSEVRKKNGLKKQLQAATDMIESLEISIKVKQFDEAGSD